MNEPITVECEDVVYYQCDVLVLKYAYGFHGADAAVAKLLKSQTISPLPGEYVLLPTNGVIPAEYVLFIGVSKLYNFGYSQIREFTRYALLILSQRLPDAKHIAMTMHGVGYGLDEREAFLSQLGGLLDLVQREPEKFSDKRITIVEKNNKRAKRLNQILLDNIAFQSPEQNSKTQNAETKEISAGISSKEKPHIFVAMPFSDEMEDVYIFGIQQPVNALGYLCERVDMDVFGGDILARIKERIETAALVIADLTNANANVYLEVGYSWGKGQRTLLLVKNPDELKFDVRGQRCIIYKSIYDLSQKIESELKHCLQ